MRRGTTPTHIFAVDIDLTDAAVLFITYRQNGKTVLEKSLEDCEITTEEIRVTLSQEDTLAFSVEGKVEIQIRAKYPSGDAVACQIIRTSANVILKEGVI